MQWRGNNDYLNGMNEPDRSSIRIIYFSSVFVFRISFVLLDSHQRKFYTAKFD